MFKKMTDLRLPILLLMAMTAIFMVSCSKDDDTPPLNLASKEYALTYSGANVGKVLIKEKADGNASVTVTLNSDAVISGASPTASIIAVVTGTEAGLYASLTTFAASATTSVTDPVKDATGTNPAIKYADLIAKTGYLVKVNVSGVIQYTATL